MRRRHYCGKESSKKPQLVHAGITPDALSRRPQKDKGFK